MRLQYNILNPPLTSTLPPPLNRSDGRENAISFSRFYFETLFPNVPHDKLDHFLLSRRKNLHLLWCNISHSWEVIVKPLQVNVAIIKKLVTFLVWRQLWTLTHLKPMIPFNYSWNCQKPVPWRREKQGKREKS